MKLRSLLTTSLALAAFAFTAEAKPLKVFILAGQSNMDGQANVSTIDFLGEDPDPARAALLKKFKPDGKTLVTRDDVWVANGGVYDKLQPGFGGRKNYDKLGSNIGPEYAFGYFMGEALEEQVLLIKYGPGGQSLYVNFRPPSAGMPHAKGMKPEDVGSQYRVAGRLRSRDLKNLKKHFPAYDEKAGYEIAGFVWFQGYNDMFDETAPQGIRQEPGLPDQGPAQGVQGPGHEGGRGRDGRQRRATTKSASRRTSATGSASMNTVPEFKGNVKAIETAPLLHPESRGPQDRRLAEQGARSEEATRSRRKSRRCSSAPPRTWAFTTSARAASSSCSARRSPTRCWS